MQLQSFCNDSTSSEYSYHLYYQFMILKQRKITDFFTESCKRNWFYIVV